MGAQAQGRRPVRRLIGICILIVAVVGPSTLYAQLPSRPLTTVAAVESSAPPVEQSPDSVRLLVGRSAIVNVGKPIARVSLTSADVADALVTSPNELLVNGKMPGTISMFVWDRGGAIRRYEVVVQRDLARLSDQVKQLFPKESIEVRANGKTAVLSGIVSSKEVADKIASLAGSFVDSKDEIVSLLQVGETPRSNQVLLRVRFAEVSRSAMTQLGVNLFTSPTGVGNTIGSTTTQQFPAPTFSNLQSTNAGSSFGSPVTSATGAITFSDFLNLFLYSEKFNLGAVVQALQTKGLFQSLAEPNLIAESGKEASFLAGGEFPIPIAQGSGGGTVVTVQFKEFGIRLTFTPVVIGNRVHLKVRPEVSTLDYSNAVTLNGFQIPALSTRRTETEIELNDGQTFAIAGLLSNTMNSTLSKMPGIGDIPVLGLLFRSKQAQRNQTELVVMITPEILPNNSSGVTPNLPRQMEPFLPPLPLKQSFEPPPPAFRPSATGSEIARPVTPTAATTPSPAGTPSAQSPAGAQTALTPAAAAPAASTVSLPAAQTTPGQAESNPPAEPARPLTAQQQKAQKQEQEAATRAQEEETKRQAIQTEADRRQQKTENERQAKLAREQAVRDAEAAKQAEQAARKQTVRDAEAAKQAEQAARKQEARDAEAAKKQAEIDKKKQASISEAEQRFKAAEAAYQAELAKQQHP